MRELYLDANAHVPMNPKAIQAFSEFCLSPAGHGHPLSPSQPGRLAATALEVARGKIASLIGAARPGQIIFTSSCTQACEWGLEMFFEKTTISTSVFGEEFYSVATSPVEHSAVRDAFSVLFSEFSGQNNVNYLSINDNGRVREDSGYGYNCCIHVQNELGTIQPIEKLHGYLFSDMSQSLGKIPVNVSDLNVDIAVFGAHKFGGPGSFGFIYLKDVNDWESFGAGSRYFLDRPGTPDVASTVATAVALEEALSSLEKRTQNMVAFRDTLEVELDKLGIEVVGQGAERCPNTTFISLPQKGLYDLFTLGEKGIHAGLGSACGSMHAGDSPLMKALGRSGGAHDFIRISQFGEYNEEDAKYFLSVLEKCL